MAESIGTTTLADPPRLVLDFAVPDSAVDEFVAPIAGANVVLSGPIETVEDALGFRVGDSIEVSGWLRPRADSNPYYRIITPRESWTDMTSSNGAVPFLTEHGPVPLSTEVGNSGAFVEFELRLDTTEWLNACLLYTSPSPRDGLLSRMPSSA